MVLLALLSLKKCFIILSLSGIESFSFHGGQLCSKNNYRADSRVIELQSLFNQLSGNTNCPLVKISSCNELKTKHFNELFSMNVPEYVSFIDQSIPL